MWQLLHLTSPRRGIVLRATIIFCLIKVAPLSLFLPTRHPCPCRGDRPGNHNHQTLLYSLDTAKICPLHSSFYPGTNAEKTKSVDPSLATLCRPQRFENLLRFCYRINSNRNGVTNATNVACNTSGRAGGHQQRRRIWRWLIVDVYEPLAARKKKEIQTEWSPTSTRCRNKLDCTEKETLSSIDKPCNKRSHVGDTPNAVLSEDKRFILLSLLFFPLH